MMGTTIVVNDEFMKLKITKLRNKNTNFNEFHKNTNQISMLLCAHVGKELALKEIKVETPIEATTGYQLENPIILVPILRAGIGMLEGFRSIIDDSSVGFIGVARNEETLKPEYYYDKIPQINKNATVLILDPMLATGGSANFAIKNVKKQGYKNISICSIIAVQEGIDNIRKEHPEINIYTAILDRGLNDIGYICPGLGDAGDRIFGTE